MTEEDNSIPLLAPDTVAQTIETRCLKKVDGKLKFDKTMAAAIVKTDRKAVRNRVWDTTWGYVREWLYLNKDPSKMIDRVKDEFRQRLLKEEL